MLSAATWMDPEVVIVSKGSETEKIDISSKKTSGKISLTLVLIMNFFNMTAIA